MGIQMPIRKKVTLIPNSNIQRDFPDIPNNYQRLPFYFIIMVPNFTGTIFKAIRRNENSFAVVYVSVYVGFILSRLYLSKYISMPKNEKLVRYFWLKLHIWFMYTAITFGFVYQLAEFPPLQTTVAMYILVSVSSWVLFFVFVIVDLVQFWKIWRHGEDIDAGKSNYHSVSILEKV